VKPLVSVITPVFNAERFLPEAIESVLAQTFDDWELLVVDDGSQDRSSEIARAYAAGHPRRVRYLEHPGHANRGATTSRNLGIQACAGEYIAFLDADDVWLPGKLADQLQIFATEPRVDMVCGAPQFWRSWAGQGGADYIASPGPPRDCLVEPPALLTLNYPLGPGPAPCPSDLLLRRAAVERVGGFEEEFQGELQLYEDQAFLAKIYLTARVLMANTCWLKYRLHPESCDARVRGAGRENAVRLYFLHWLEGYLRDQGVDDRATWSALRRVRRRARHPIVYHAMRRLHETPAAQLPGLMARAVRRLILRAGR
jgi:glycosyltransferase involved in cell wall biosynthesis